MLHRVDIDSVWDQMEPDVRRLLKDPAHADPETLYEACKSGSAHCLQGDQVLLVTRLDWHPWLDKPEMLIWWGNSFVETDKAFANVLPELLALAREQGCLNLVFHSTISGWFRLAPRLGFTLRNMEFAMEVAP